jgi:hypothetical protein
MMAPYHIEKPGTPPIRRSTAWATVASSESNTPPQHLDLLSLDTYHKRIIHLE